MNRPRRLSASFVRTINRPGRYGDGRGGFGLSLLVKSRSAGGFSKTWSQRLILGGKPVNIGLGAWPVVTLAEAREAALRNRREVAQGRDPRYRPPAVPTFAEAAEQVIRINARGWKKGGKSEAQWRSSLHRFVLPHLGDRRVNEIQARDVMSVLLPIWNTLPETGRRTRRRIAAVMKWAVAQGYRTDNPAGGALSAALPRNAIAPRHFRALPFAQVPAALQRVRESRVYPARALCLEFLVLCAVRSGESRHARWDEIDSERAIWTIPAERMKARRTHRVPLSRQALRVLSVARGLGEDSECVFPAPGGQALNDASLSRLCSELDLGCVPHGMRSSFRDWAAECSDAPREVCELALAHVNSDRVERAYRRTDLFDRRRKLMQEWADYIGPLSGAESDTFGFGPGAPLRPLARSR